jgi:hypothetical protein
VTRCAFPATDLVSDCILVSEISAFHLTTAGRDVVAALRPCTLVRRADTAVKNDRRPMTAWAKACGASCGRLCPTPPAPNDPVCIFVREFLCIGTVVRMRCTMGITFKGDGGHGDDRALGKPPFQIVVFRLAWSPSLPPAVIVDHDAVMIRAVEGRRAAIECGIIEVPRQINFARSCRYLS